jgi:hypothetical protein
LCRSKCVEPLKNFRIINSITKLHLVGISTEITRRLHTFINKGLRRIMNIKWTDKITNEELWGITKQKPIEIEITRKWYWIGQTLCKGGGAIEKTALD